MPKPSSLNGFTPTLTHTSSAAASKPKVICAAGSAMNMATPLRASFSANPTLSNHQLSSKYGPTKLSNIFVT